MGEAIWTPEELMAATERRVRLPYLSTLLGRECAVRIRKGARAE